MQPRDRLTAKEIQVATLVWQGLTNKDIARVLTTSEQVVKNYLHTAFDKLGVWTRLELALYVAGHGGANWHVQLGNGLMAPLAGWGVAAGDQGSAYPRAKEGQLQLPVAFPRNRVFGAQCSIRMTADNNLGNDSHPRRKYDLPCRVEIRGDRSRHMSCRFRAARLSHPQPRRGILSVPFPGRKQISHSSLFPAGQAPATVRWVAGITYLFSVRYIASSGRRGLCCRLPRRMQSR
jgi:DNA-binding CsgD family transcriptional regulator